MAAVLAGSGALERRFEPKMALFPAEQAPYAWIAAISGRMPMMFMTRVTEQRQSVLKRLDRGTKLPQLSGDGILLGDGRFNLDRTAISEAIEKRDA